eukprot:5855296-Prymnesium_polylepis.3
MRRRVAKAEADYAAAEEQLATALPAAEAANSKAAAASVRAAKIERDAAAQVAEAQASALRDIEEAVQATITDRGLMTQEELGAYPVLKSKESTVPAWLERATANVMKQKTASGGTVELKAGETARGRGLHYQRVVQSIKASDQLKHTQLWERSKQLMKEVARLGVSESGTERQLGHALNANKTLVKGALKYTFLAPPKAINMTDCLALKKEMSGALWDEVMSFIRKRCGVKVDVTRKEIQGGVQRLRIRVLHAQVLGRDGEDR